MGHWQKVIAIGSAMGAIIGYEMFILWKSPVISSGYTSVDVCTHIAIAANTTRGDVSAMESFL